MDRITSETILLCGPPVQAVGGGPTHIRNMLASPLRHRYRLVHFESGSRGTESPAKDEPFVKKLSRIVGSPFALGWALWKYSPGVIHLNSALDQKGFWRDLAYMLVGKLFRKKVALQIHGGSLADLCSSVGMKRVVRAVLSFPDAVVLLASSEKRQFDDFGLTTRVVVIPNGVDVAQYSGSTPRRHSGQVKRLIYLGRLIPTKGIFETIDAVEILRTDPKFSDIEFHIAGSGPAEKRLRDTIQRKRLENCVKLVGSLHGTDKVHFLQTADLFLFPTYHREGLPYSILESLAAGTPVVASRVAGIPDVVIDGQHGALIDAKSTAQIVDAIRRLASEGRIGDMSRNCHEWATKRLGLKRLADEFDALYSSLLPRGRYNLPREDQVSGRT